LIKREPVADVEVQAIQVGPAVFVSNPAEYFVEFGLEIKGEEPLRFHVPGRAFRMAASGMCPTEEALLGLGRRLTRRG
jgi:hypothetical protein